MKRLFFLCLALALLAVGCSAKTYYHPKRPQAEWDSDKANCEYNVEVLQETGRLDGKTFSEGVKDCMRAKGYVFGHEPQPTPEAAKADYMDDTQTEYSILEGAYHTQELAEKRRDYLMSTKVRGVFVRQMDLGSEGVWYWVLIGSRETLSGAQQLQAELYDKYGITHMRIIKRQDVAAAY